VIPLTLYPKLIVLLDTKMWLPYQQKSYCHG
jgi:hypothetical protein